MDANDPYLVLPFLAVALVIWAMWHRRGRQVARLEARVEDLSRYVAHLDEADRLVGQTAPSAPVVPLPARACRYRLIEGGKRLVVALGLGEPLRAARRGAQAHPVATWVATATVVAAALVATLLWATPLRPGASGRTEVLPPTPGLTPKPWVPPQAGARPSSSSAPKAGPGLVDDQADEELGRRAEPAVEADRDEADARASPSPEPGPGEPTRSIPVPRLSRLPEPRGSPACLAGLLCVHAHVTVGL